MSPFKKAPYVVVAPAPDFPLFKSLDRLTAGTLTAVQNASIVLIPNEGFADYTEPILSDGSADFFQFLRDNTPDGAAVELAIEDQDYKELVLHFDVLVLPTILLSSLLLPTVAQLIANYIERRGARLKDTEVRASIYVHRTEGTRKKTMYEGPADAPFNVNSPGPFPTEACRQRAWSAHSCATCEPVRPGGGTH